jgi:hypothetical protein
MLQANGAAVVARTCLTKRALCGIECTRNAHRAVDLDLVFDDASTGSREIDRGFAAPAGVPVRRWPG